MLVFHLTCLALSAALGGATSPPQIRADTAADTTQTLLSGDILSRLTTFWTSLQKEPAAIQKSVHALPEKTIPVHMGGPLDNPKLQIFYRVPQTIDVPLVAATVPAVAGDLRKAHLTPQAWEQSMRAVSAATVARVFLEKGMGFGAGAVTMQNVAFLKAHAKELQALSAAGVPLPTVANIQVTTQ